MSATSKPTIIFVDDEKGVLDGLRRGLWGWRDEWNMVFAVGGEEALTVMRQQKPDVVITDMRMPGMDGAALLNRVRQLYPQSARIVLSGYSEREAVFRTVGPAHQYFAKPCSPQVLVEAIRRALNIRRTLHAPELLSLVGGVQGLPAMPKALTQLIEELQSPDGSAAEVARIIASDVGLTANLLKLTNSSFFCLPVEITDPLQAVRLLGFDMVRTLTIMAGLFEGFRCQKQECALINRLERRSLEIGMAARRIAEAEDLGRAAADQAQCAGLLSHVGSLLLLAHWPTSVSAIQAELDRQGGDIVEVEQSALGACHAQLGGVLLGLWGFSDAVVEAVLYHHHPGHSEAHTHRAQSPLAAVHAAQFLIRPQPEHDDPEAGWRLGLDMEYLTEIGVRSKVPHWAEIATRTRQEYESCVS